jgi:hypothetical protein
VTGGGLSQYDREAKVLNLRTSKLEKSSEVVILIESDRANHSTLALSHSMHQL